MSSFRLHCLSEWLGLMTVLYVAPIWLGVCMRWTKWKRCFTVRFGRRHRGIVCASVGPKSKLTTQAWTQIRAPFLRTHRAHNSKMPQPTTAFALAFMCPKHFSLFSTILKSKLSLLELGDICIIVCLTSMAGCTVYLVGALRGQGACTMYTLSSVDRWWRR